MTIPTLLGKSYAGGLYGIGPVVKADMNDAGAIQFTGAIDAVGYMPCTSGFNATGRGLAAAIIGAPMGILNEQDMLNEQGMQQGAIGVDPSRPAAPTPGKSWIVNGITCMVVLPR
jgi:hypothetical protein